ncbi:MAG: hypothetical protein ABFR50_07720 [Candidatus Fermentibacteria bacterium]
MDAGRPGSIAIAGSRKEEVHKWIENRIPFPCVLLKDLDEYDDPGRMLFAVLCPGDNGELENMYLETGNDLLSSAVPSLAVLSFPPGVGITFPILLHQSAFSLKLLRRITCSAGIHTDAAVNLNSIGWERTGSLLPFYIHNMNNVLARIMGNIELAELLGGTPGKVKEKLSIALESTEDLKRFLEKLTFYSITDGDKSEWTAGSAVDVLELCQMSSGTSVEFTYEEKSGVHGSVPVRKNLMNLLTGLIAASAIVSVNGCGSVKMSVAPHREALEIRVAWSSSQKSAGLCPGSMDSAADLLNRAALMALSAKLYFRLGAWNSDGGSVSLLVPINKEDVLNAV